MQLTKNNITELLDKTVELLKNIPTEDLKSNQGIDFEVVLQKNLQEAVSIIGYDNVKEVELVSGHRYPDIVIHTHDTLLGIEVKTSKSKGWSTLGGSIFESTRVKGVEDIVLFFANFNDLTNIAFRFAWMEDCISDVVITHKPRYAINMDVEDTFFKRAGVEYKELQNNDKPFSLIRDYLKKRGGKSADLWWVDETEENNIDNLGPQSIRRFATLTKEEKNRINAQLCIIFTEFLSESPTKYERITLFLISKLGLINSSIRDSFSAAGQYDFKGHLIPKYFQKILDPINVEAIRREMGTIPVQYLEEYWSEFIPNEPIITQWKRHVVYQVRTNGSLTPEIRDKIISSLDEIFG
ncbi:TPA: hypothetical protein ACVU5T_004282 [Vibrio parahaemolyticus]